MTLSTAADSSHGSGLWALTRAHHQAQHQAEIWLSTAEEYGGHRQTPARIEEEFQEEAVGMSILIGLLAGFRCHRGRFLSRAADFGLMLPLFRTAVTGGAATLPLTRRRGVLSLLVIW
ncbi:hypothetical protein LINPERHAP1_LOCUS8992 [Linum perenne]